MILQDRGLNGLLIIEILLVLLKRVLRSMKEDLHIIALDIYKSCLVNGISLEMEWISRSHNNRADFIDNPHDADE